MIERRKIKKVEMNKKKENIMKSKKQDFSTSKTSADVFPFGTSKTSTDIQAVQQNYTCHQQSWNPNII